VDPRILLRLNSIVSQLDPRFALSDSQVLTWRDNDTDSRIDVCENPSNSSRADQLLYQQNDPPLCKGTATKRPISELITVLVNNIDPDAKMFLERLQIILDGIRGYHLFLPVIVADANTNITHAQKALSVAKTCGNVRLITVEPRLLQTPGAIWNILVAEARTPYVLVASDLSHFNAYSRL
jgi:hypothetical protein